jgi:hypothetical protein
LQPDEAVPVALGEMCNRHSQVAFDILPQRFGEKAVGAAIRLNVNKNGAKTMGSYPRLSICSIADF